MENTNMSGNIIKVLVCDDTASNGVRIASELSRLGLFAYTRKNEGDIILHSILTDKPDVVIADLSLNGTDAVSVMNSVQKILSQYPAFIIFSEINNSFVERQVLENGAAYFLVKPFSTEKLLSIIKSVVHVETGNCGDVELMVTELIQKLGVPANVRGYGYIRTAILECVDNREYLNGITKLLYPKVAAAHNTTPSRVERAIRHAIDTAWQRGDRNVIYSFFGYRADLFNRPTNSEFISLAADKIRLSMKPSSANRFYYNDGNANKYLLRF